MMALSPFPFECHLADADAGPRVTDNRDGSEVRW